jgi:hypothetical protein
MQRSLVSAQHGGYIRDQMAQAGPSIRVNERPVLVPAPNRIAAVSAATAVFSTSS